MKRKIPLVWEQIDENMFRCAVYRGWIVRIEVGKNFTTTFVPDDVHQWLVVKPVQEETRRKE